MEPKQIKTAIQWTGTNKEEVRSHFPNSWFLRASRACNKKMEQVVCIENDDIERWVFPGDWIVQFEVGKIKIMTNLSYIKKIEKGEIKKL